MPSSAALKLFITAQDLAKGALKDQQNALKMLGKTAEQVNRKTAGGGGLMPKKTVGDLVRARREAERLRESVAASFEFSGLKRRIGELQQMGKLTMSVGAGDQARAVMARQRVEQKAQRDAQLDQLILGRQVANQQKKSAATMLKSLSQIGRSLKSTGVIAGAGIGALSFAAIGVGIAFNDMKDKAQMSFETIFHDAGTAKQLLADMTTFAQKTPFDLEGVIDAGRMLGAFGFKAKEIIPLLTQIGDASAGLGLGADGIQRITIALGQMKQKGKVSAQEMMQLTEAGVPAWDILADHIGQIVPRLATLEASYRKRVQAMKDAGRIPITVDVDERARGALISRLQKMAELGQLPLQEVLDNLTTGMEDRFGGLMDKMSGSLTGLLSNLHDTFQQTMGDLTEETMPALKGAIGGVTAALGGVRTMLRALPGPARMVVGGFAEMLAAAAPILGALTPLIGGAIGGMIGGPGGAAIGTAVGGAAGMASMGGKLAPGVPQMASGGVVNRPTLALIGEAGPEAVIPLASGGVFGAGSTGAVGGLAGIGPLLGLMLVSLVHLPGLIGTAVGSAFVGILNAGRWLATATWNFVKGVGGFVWDVLQAGASRGGAILRGAWNFAKGAASAAWDLLTAGVSRGGQVLRGVWNFVQGAASEAWGFLRMGWSRAGVALRGVWNFGAGVASEAWGFLRGGASRAGQLLRGVWQFAAGAASEAWAFLRAGASRGGAILRGAWNFAAGAATEAWSFLRGGVSRGGQVLRGVWNFVQGAASEAWGFLRGGVSRGGQLLRGIWNFGAGATSEVWGFLRAGISRGGAALRGVWTFLQGDAVRGVWGFLAHGIETAGLALRGVWTFAQAAGGAAWGIITAGVSAGGLLMAGVVALSIAAGAGIVYGVYHWLFGGTVEKLERGVNVALERDPSTPVSLWDWITGSASAVGRLFVGGAEQHATGGFISRPHLGLVGEAGPELILPLSNAARMRQLMKAYGPLISRYMATHHFRAFAGGGLVGRLPPGISSALLQRIARTISFNPELGSSAPGHASHPRVNIHNHFYAPVTESAESWLVKTQQRALLRGRR